MQTPFVTAAPLPSFEDTEPSWLPSHLRGERDQFFIAYLGLMVVVNAAFMAVSWLVDFELGCWIHLTALLMAVGMARLRWCKGHCWPGSRAASIRPW